jgi:enolase
MFTVTDRKPGTDSAIVEVVARQVLDSRGSPTLEADVRLRSGARGRAAVPSGGSTGNWEPLESRDHDRRFRGRGVRHAVRLVREEVADAIRGRDATDQEAIDSLLVALDGTLDKHRLGGNTLLSVSLACAHAAAAHCGVELWQYLGGDRAHPLPVPMLTVLEGGVHARSGLDIQELAVVPWKAETVAGALDTAVRVYWSLGDLLASRGEVTAVGDTGGFAPRLRSVESALEMTEAAIDHAGYHPGDEVVLAIDAAASQWRRGESYALEREGALLSREELADRWVKLLARHPIVALEDPFAEDDREGWALLHGYVGDRVQLVGDDVFVTSPALLRKGIEEHVANAVVIKPNQVGTLSETLRAIAIAREAGWGVIVSHRSGETEDTTIADLAVATQAGQIKAGAPCRGERIAKYNRLLRIEEELGDEAQYAGRGPFAKHSSVPVRL